MVEGQEEEEEEGDEERIGKSEKVEEESERNH